ncbi:MAG: carbohydrate binding domain-containing protein [Sedimentisphaerales bacterium]|nr:carbohydrate binding domain-containing protein [Sedimentisphaerales bacterium]
MSFFGLCKSLLLLMLVSTTTACGAVNLVDNPGFEQGDAGWSGRSCLIDMVSSPVHSGSAAVKAYDRYDNWQGIRQSMLNKMVAGKTYRVSGWVKLENASSDSVMISFEQQDGDGTNYHNAASGTANDSYWTELTGEFTLEVNGALSVLDLYIEGPEPEVILYVDDINVYEAKPGDSLPDVAGSPEGVQKKAAPAEVNVLVNPGFEDGDTGWSGRSCPIDTVSSPIHSGSAAAKAYARTDTWQGIKQSMLDKMVAGETYHVSGWVRLDNTATDSVMISFEQQDGDGTNYHNAATATANNNEWVELSGEFTLDVNGSLSVLDLYVEGPAPEVIIYVDDMKVYGLKPGADEPAADVGPVPAVKSSAAGRIDVNKRYQMIEGFGAGGAHYTMEFVEHEKKDELFKILFKDLSLDIFRIRNNYDMEENSFKETVEIVKGGQAALGRDLKVMMSSWSPPAYLKSEDRTVGGTLKKIDGKYVYDEFAQWWYDSLVAYKKAGVKVDYLNIQNEVDYLAGWDSCLFEPTETATMAGYDAAFEAVWKKLHKEMGSSMPKMLAPETSGLNRLGAYIYNLDDLSHVYGYAHHLYNCEGDGDQNSGCGAAPDLYIPMMQEIQFKYSDKPLFQTEFEHQPGPWTDALNTALVMHNSLTVEGVAAYIYWELFWGYGTGLVSLEDPSSYTISHTYYAFKQFSAFIDAGWQRVDAASDYDNVRISAYISPDNKKLTVVIINTTEIGTIPLDLSVDGFSISKGEIYRSNLIEKCFPAGSFDASGPLPLRPNSITTIVFTAD